MDHPKSGWICVDQDGNGASNLESCYVLNGKAIFATIS
jgi:hypothetical protein